MIEPSTVQIFNVSSMGRKRIGEKSSRSLINKLNNRGLKLEARLGG